MDDSNRGQSEVLSERRHDKWIITSCALAFFHVIQLYVKLLIAKEEGSRGPWIGKYTTVSSRFRNDYRIFNQSNRIENDPLTITIVRSRMGWWDESDAPCLVDLADMRDLI